MIMELNHLLAVMYNELDTQKRENCLKFTVSDLLYQTNNAFFQFCVAAANSFSEFLTDKYQVDIPETTAIRGRSNTPSPSNIDNKNSSQGTTTSIPPPSSPTFRLLENLHRANPSEASTSSNFGAQEGPDFPQDTKRQSQSRQSFGRQNFQTYQSSQQQQDQIRGPSPVHCNIDNLQGPLPNPGKLAKVPFISGARPYPFFQINVQRRWSECTGSADPENMCDNQIRRWSMPTQSRFIPMMTRQQIQQHQQAQLQQLQQYNLQHQLHQSQDYSQSTTPDSTWHSSVTSQDGLLDAIHLLSIKPISGSNSSSNSSNRRQSSTIENTNNPQMRPASGSSAMPIIYSQQILQILQATPPPTHTVDSIEVTSLNEDERQHSPQPNVYAQSSHYQPHYGSHQYGQWWVPNPISDQIVENAGGEEEEKH